MQTSCTSDTAKLTVPAMPKSRRAMRAARTLLKHLRDMFQSRNSLQDLDPRLRRDAGIDELALERDAIAKSPLIRN